MCKYVYYDDVHKIHINTALWFFLIPEGFEK